MLLTEAQLAALEKAKAERETQGEFESEHPGYCKEILGTGWKGTLQTDGYEVYASYSASQPQRTHALCWAHTRRALLKAEASQPEITRQGLEMIRALYRFEEQLRSESSLQSSESGLNSGFAGDRRWQELRIDV